jgi:hypothetical protein
MVVAFNEGDPVPESTVEENGYLDAGLVVPRDEYEGPKEGERKPAMKRGEMPPHLQNKGDESGTAKSVKSGGASSRKPEPSKSTESKS